MILIQEKEKTENLFLVGAKIAIFAASHYKLTDIVVLTIPFFTKMADFVSLFVKSSNLTKLV
jgi:hypothetical protein